MLKEFFFFKERVQHNKLFRENLGLNKSDGIQGLWNPQHLSPFALSREEAG